MKKVNMSKEEMLRQRVSLVKDLKSSAEAFADSGLPGHHKENFNIIGPGVTEDPALEPAITDPHGFNLHMVKATPGNGAALHAHPTVEVFMPLSGTWKVYWDNDGEICDLMLEKWDVISVPPGVYRGFENAGAEDAFLFVVLGGKDPGRVAWAPEIVAAASALGFAFSDEGVVTTRP